MFVSVLNYHREVDRESDLFARHREFVEARVADGTLLCSGPRAEAAGGLMIAFGEDREATAAKLDADPFVREGLATYELHGFRAALVAPEFAELGEAAP